VLRRDRSDATGIPAAMQRTDYPLLKTQGNRCCALRGTVGQSVSCSIYQDRPRACQQFQPGSPLCLEARKALNL
jgi:Fe-S-cluster containining protein